jgi:hypothetical protein
MGNSLTSLLQQATLPRNSCSNTDTRPHPNKEIVSAHGYKTLHTKWLIPTTPIQEPTEKRDIVSPHCYNRLPYQLSHVNHAATRAQLPRDIVSPHCYYRLQYQGNHFNHTDTRPHPNKGHSLKFLLQRTAQPSDSF